MTLQKIVTFPSWRGWGELTLIEFPNYPPAYVRSIAITAKDVPMPANGRADIEQFFFHGEFINGIPVYEIES